MVVTLQARNVKLPRISFTLRCVHDDDYYLANLAHEIGIVLKTAAAASKLQRVHADFYM